MSEEYDWQEFEGIQYREDSWGQYLLNPEQFSDQVELWGYPSFHFVASEILPRIDDFAFNECGLFDVKEFEILGEHLDVDPDDIGMDTFSDEEIKNYWLRLGEAMTEQCLGMYSIDDGYGMEEKISKLSQVSKLRHI